MIKEQGEDGSGGLITPQNYKKVFVCCVIFSILMIIAEIRVIQYQRKPDLELSKRLITTQPITTEGMTSTFVTDIRDIEVRDATGKVIVKDTTKKIKVWW